MLSLIIWTLLITTSIKYVAVVMRADNDGEGGILALMSLLGIKHGTRIGVITIGLLGAALLYGDGAITPAISVLSALEGLKMPAPKIAPYIVLLSALVLVGLFALQSQGSERIGKLFGPIMTFWFITIGLLGLGGILSHPRRARGPRSTLRLHYLLGHGFTGFLILGAVFLCATGAEALYADMGHFGPRPIRFAWYGLVLPTLALNYAGQTAVVVDGAVGSGRQSVFHAVPGGLAGGAGSVVDDRNDHRQPGDDQRRVFDDAAGDTTGTVSTPAHRPDLGRGLRPDLYRFVNWTLMALTLGLTLGFRSSDSLAAAFGIAVSLTMLLTSVLMFLAMREIWNWSLPLSLGVAGLSWSSIRRLSRPI